MSQSSSHRPGPLPRAAGALWLACALALSCASRAEPAPKTGSLSFALIGDMPYGEGEERRAREVIAAINASPAVGFVIHIGDLKGGGESCDDAVLRRRFRLFQELARPFVITPGDNDWTDCHRVSNGRFLPTERLARYRQIFHPDPARSTGGRAMDLRPQSATPGFEAYVENALWQAAEVTFATVHVVGSQNGLAPWRELDPDDSASRPRADRLAEVAQRETAALAWLDTTFDAARAAGSIGVVVAIHGNPGLERVPSVAAPGPYDRFLERLRRHTLAFGRPVLLLHGDTHWFRHDRPWRTAEGRELVNFARVESFGSPFVNWVEVTIDPRDPALFRVAPRAVEAPPPMR